MGYKILEAHFPSTGSMILEKLVLYAPCLIKNIVNAIPATINAFRNRLDRNR
jgi:hypothetical protein